MNAHQAMASRLSNSADITPAQKRKRADKNKAISDEWSRKKFKRSGMDESDMGTVVMSQERAKYSFQRKCATSPPC